MIHGVWLTPAEIALLGERKANLAYCPSSNMFLSDGVTDLPKMMAAGVTIGLGSDGACSNNRISVFEEMRMVSLLQKAHTLDALCINYHDAFTMGTANGGKILDLPIGCLQEHTFADFVGIRSDDLSMQPISQNGEQILPNLVYALQPTAIDKVVVNGVTTVNHGALQNISQAEVVAKVQETMRHLQKSNA